MFGLNNHRGSCWVNAALQAFFRIPEVQKRYTANQFDAGNTIDQCLCKIWKTRGEMGLQEFFEAVRTDTMPAGLNVGDSHELFQYLCDKLPFLDELCRFKMAHSMECNSCKKKNLNHDSVIEFSLDSIEGRNKIKCRILSFLYKNEIGEVAKTLQTLKNTECGRVWKIRLQALIL